MTKKEASFILANIDRRVCDDELSEALDVAIKTLEQNSKYRKEARRWKRKALEQEPCEDAIDRAKLLQRSVISVPFHMADGSVDYVDMVLAADICRAKPVQPKQKTGWWIDKNVRGEKLPYCSVCGNGLDVVYHYAYCPNCGAKMDEPQEGEE